MVKKLILMIGALLSALVVSAQSSTSSSVPDFAFPSKVSADALASLDRSVTAGDGPSIIRSLIDFTVARMSVDTDSLESVMKVIDSTQAKVTSPSTLAMIDLLKARIYNDVYASDRWVFDRRTLPITPLPENVREWSGEQFRGRILDLCRRAVSRREALESVPLRSYAKVLKANNLTYIYYPTLFDFTVASVISLTDGYITSYNLYKPDQLLTTTAIDTPRDSMAQFVSDTYSALIAANPRIGAPRINSRLGYLNFLSDHMDWGDDNRGEHLFQAMATLYREYSTSEYSGDILKACYDAPAAWLYGNMTEFLKHHPAYYDVNSIRNRLNELSRPSAQTRVVRACAPDDDAKLRINVKNASEVTLAVYQLTSPSILTESWITLSKTPHRLVGRHTRHVEGTVPFDTTITMEIPAFRHPGYYVVVAELPGVATETGSSHPVIHCTRVAAGLYRYDSTELLALDPLTGAPYSGASVLFRPSSYSHTKYSPLGITDSDGFMKLPDGKQGEYLATVGTDRFGLPVYTLPNSIKDRRDKDETTAGAIYPALGLVRPGDTLEVAAVAYTYGRITRKVLAGTPLTMYLTDVNGENVDTIKATSDGFGRIHGVFTIPEGRLTGDYRITLVRDDISGRQIASRYVTVSDYKLPSFRITVENVLMSSPADGDVTITGRVATYSGFGMADVSLTMRLSVSSGFWWWRGYNTREISSESVNVDPDGQFRAVIPASAFASSPYPKGAYTAEFQATSSTGETQSASRRFSLSKAYAIRAEIPASLEISVPVHLNVKVVDSEDKPVEATIEYEFYNDSDTLRGRFSTSDPVVDLSSLPVDEYSLRLTACDDIAPDCLPYTVDDEGAGDIALYRRDGPLSPSHNILWAPETSFTAEIGSEIEILYGLRRLTDTELKERGDYHVYYILSANDSIIERRWLQPGEGLHTLKVTMPDAQSAHIGLYTTRDYMSDRCEFTITSAESKRTLRIDRESFRDHLTPGATEKWILRVSCPGNDKVSAAAIADMYNRALDAITSAPSWRLTPDSYYAVTPSWTSPASYGSFYISVNGKVKYLRSTNVTVPVLNTYGHQLYGDNMMRKFMSSAPTSMRIRGAKATVENMSTAEEVADYSAFEGRAAGVSVTNGKMEAANFDMDDAVEEAVEEEAALTSDSSDSGNNSATAADEFAYRDAETPLAFFRPELSTDNDGHIVIEFSAPNANASWSFNLLAWTEQMITGSTQVDVTASKPIMVQPNLPRFLRTGDRVTLKAMVMNNTDSMSHATALIEIFDPATGVALQAPSRRELTLAPNASEVVETILEVPAGITFAGYRIKAFTDGFADGEQTAIKVLPASQPLVHTQPFYMAPGQKEMEMKISEMPSDSRVTLEYCANPVWYVVTALPGLSSETPATAIDAAVSIFSTAVARGLLRDNPSLAEAVKEWNASDQADSTLVSMLERNTDLKTVLLQATPWMMDARSDSERMTRLALLFDSKRCDKAIREAVDMLDKLHDSDGGWGWTPQFIRSSEWVTYMVLDKLGALRKLGYTPSDKRLESMITDALGYIDRNAVKDFRRYPEGNYLQYTILRDLFPDVPQSSEARHVSDVTLQRILSSWKNYDVRTKALAAMTLTAHGYPSVASQIIASVKDYAVTSPEKGMWWPSAGDGGEDQLITTARVLDAILTVDPSSHDVNLIRQWLIYQKEARDWGDGASATSVIASVLTSSKDWITPAKMPSINVRRHKIDTSGASARIGYLRCDISDLNPSGAQLTVRRPDDGLTPAWGAVYEQYIASMDSIPAQSCDAVSVTRRITPVNGDQSLKIGDRVKVQLIINVSDAMDYVAVTDERAACLEPVEQLPGYIFSEGIGFYRENLDASTRIFIDHLPKGTYILTYDMYVSQAGKFASGVATVQSQYAPSRIAHSASSPLLINE